RASVRGEDTEAHDLAAALAEQRFDRRRERPADAAAPPAVLHVEVVQEPERGREAGEGALLRRSLDDADDEAHELARRHGDEDRAFLARDLVLRLARRDGAEPGLDAPAVGRLERSERLLE